MNKKEKRHRRFAPLLVFPLHTLMQESTLIDTAFQPSPPSNVAEWIKGSNIIIQGTVIKVVQEGYTSGFDLQTGAIIWRDKQNNRSSNGETPVPEPVIPLTIFKVKVESLYQSNGLVNAGNSITLSFIGRLNSADTDQTAMPQLGAKYLFVLNQSPDKVTYSLPRVCGMIVIGRNSVECPGEYDIKLPFLKGLEPAVFITQLQNAIAVEK